MEEGDGEKETDMTGSPRAVLQRHPAVAPLFACRGPEPHSGLHRSLFVCFLSQLLCAVAFEPVQRATGRDGHGT